MAVTRIEILQRRPYADGRSFGNTGSYERIDAIAHYCVDPGHEINKLITDLNLATTGSDGLVHFSGDLTLLQPFDPSAGNRALLLAVPNRGRRMLTHINIGQVPITPSAKIEPGDGFLFEEGWTIAWTGWQCDVPRDSTGARIGLEAPQVPLHARGPRDKMQLRLQVNHDHECLPLTDQHVGDLGRHRPIQPLDLEDPEATLMVRDSIYAVPKILPRDCWRFALVEGDKVIEDPEHVWLRGGFRAGLIYDLLYQPRDCPVVGAGLLATRDMAGWLRRDPQSPTADRLDHVIGEGISQCGRFWRTFIYLGLNQTDTDQPAVDGVLCHIAGARRGEFNQRYGQPSVQPTPSLGHLFPFADEEQQDPFRRQRDGLLLRQRAAGYLPKIMYTDTSAEYWRGDAALSHTDLVDNGDVEPPSKVRRYLFSSTQHSSAVPTLSDTSLYGSRGGNPINTVDYRPLYRSCLTNLLTWVTRDEAPPASLFPRFADGSRWSRLQALDHLAAIPGLSLPDPAVMTVMRPLDLGPNADRGKPDLPAQAGEDSYPDWVSALDDDGNEIAGIAMPFITCPLATHTGFNPRHPKTGGVGQLLEYFGSTLPFARDIDERAAANDPRPAISERYRDRAEYLAQVRKVAEKLAAGNYLLARDIDLCCELAAERYDVVLAQSE